MPDDTLTACLPALDVFVRAQEQDAALRHEAWIADHSQQGFSTLP